MRETTYFGNYRGIVVNNYDPELAGKIQVRVLPVFQSIDDAVLPWAIPAMPISSGAGYGTGTLAIPIVGSFVWVFFEEGDIYQPVYFAEAQNLAYGIPAQTQAGYPNTRVISFPSGIQLIVDDTTPSITILHPTQSVIVIDGNGKTTVSSANDLDLSALVNVAISAGAIASITAPAVSVLATGLINISGGTATVQSTGTATLQSSALAKVAGATVEIDGTASVKISGLALGLYGTAPVPRPGPIPVATNIADVITAYNALLVALKAVGIVT